MKKVFGFMVAVCLAVGITGVSFGAERATTKDAESMVKKAVAYIKANGKEKAFAEFNNTKGKFIHKDVYVTVYDMNGKCLAHGQNAKMVGKDLMELKDADGKYLIKERVEVVKAKGKGWQDYKYTNPVSKTIEHKTTYFEKYEDVIVACGVYKQ
jgi:signal transduction histidine kinase